MCAAPYEVGRFASRPRRSAKASKKQVEASKRSWPFITGLVLKSRPEDKGCAAQKLLATLELQLGQITGFEEVFSLRVHLESVLEYIGSLFSLYSFFQNERDIDNKDNLFIAVSKSQIFTVKS